MNRKHLTTVKDIAKALNISVATVSRALRDTYDVSRETRELVLAKARELNYRVNYNARGLTGYRKNTIGILVPTISNYYFSTVISGIQSVANANDFNMILYVTEESLEKEISIINSLSVSSVDGLLVCITKDSYECSHLEDIIDSGVPIVFFDRVAEHISASKVTQDDYKGAYMATEHLIKKGYRRIAHITGSLDLTLTQDRVKGYLDCLRKNDFEFNPDYIIESSFTQESGMTDIKNLWTLKEKPDAIFAVNDRKGVGAILQLKKMNIKVGKEVGVIGFTNDPIAAIVSPTLTTIEEPAFEIGSRSCDLLIKHISKKNFIKENIVLDCRLIERQSTKRS